MKTKSAVKELKNDIVASFAEAWIEKLLSCILIFLELVASFAEAWIENYQNLQIQSENLSPPSRRRGLKNLIQYRFKEGGQSRLLRGGVD